MHFANFKSKFSLNLPLWNNSFANLKLNFFRNPDVSKEKVEEVLNAVEQIGISQGGYITIQNLRVSGFPGLE